MPSKLSPYMTAMPARKQLEVGIRDLQGINEKITKLNVSLLNCHTNSKLQTLIIIVNFKAYLEAGLFKR